MFYCGYFGQTLTMFEGWFLFQGLLKVWTVLFLLCWFVYNGCPLFYVQTNLKKKLWREIWNKLLALKPKAIFSKKVFHIFPAFLKNVIILIYCYAMLHKFNTLKPRWFDKNCIFRQFWPSKQVFSALVILIQLGKPRWYMYGLCWKKKTFLQIVA